MLYLLEPIREHDPWYDKVVSLVVRATNKEHARTLASKACGDEGPAFWLSPALSRCEPIDANGEPAVLCRDCQEA